MKKLVLVLMLVVSVFGSGLNTQSSICDAVKEATAKTKPIMFVITRDGCKYCDILKKKTLKDKKLQKELNDNFVVVIANTSRGGYIPAELRNVTGVPSIWFLYKNGLSMYSSPAGAPQDTKNFIDMLKEVEGRFYYLEKKFGSKLN